MLPGLARQEQLVKEQTVRFGGYNHNAAPREGDLYDMKNLTGALYPVLSPRKGRTRTATLAKPNGLCAAGALCWVDGTGFYYNGVKKGTVTDGAKRFARLGAYVLIFPDKAYYNSATDSFGLLETSWTGTAAITHHSYDAQTLEAGAVYCGNAIKTTGAAFPFEAGEAVFLSGSSVVGNNIAPVIRAVEDGGKTLIFSNNSFAEHGAEALTLARKVPEMEFFCENENRLWGCKDNEIYACALGNPFRWNNYEGLATDSYAVSVGSDGAFTGACAFLGYAMFFKEDAIHKIYGGKPSNFQVMSSAVSGVAAGSGASLAIAGEVLFYLSRTGIVSYSGGIPVSVSTAFGPAKFDEAVGGSDGRRYLVSLRSGTLWSLFCYDTATGLWHREDETHALGFARKGGILHLLDAADNGLYSLESGDCAGIPWMAETGDLSDGGPDKAGIGKVQLRLETDPGSTVQVALQFDSDGVWRVAAELASTRKRTYLLPILPRRCDHYRIRLSGTGGCRVFSLTRQFYRGGER